MERVVNRAALAIEQMEKENDDNSEEFEHLF